MSCSAVVKTRSVMGEIITVKVGEKQDIDVIPRDETKIYW